MRSEGIERKAARLKSKVVAGIVSLMIATVATTGIAFADVDLQGTLMSWFGKKTELAIESLEQSIKAETETQKGLLEQQLRQQLADASSEIDTFTETERNETIKAIQDHAANLLEANSIDSEADLQQIQNKLQQIADSAISAMNSLVNSYTPPSVEFVPSATTKQPNEANESGAETDTSADELTQPEVTQPENSVQPPTAESDNELPKPTELTDTGSIESVNESIFDTSNEAIQTDTLANEN